MQDLGYVLENFFTHKDFLVDASLIPGTLYTPLHFIFEAVLLVIIIMGVIYLNKHREYIKRTFTWIWVTLLVLEIAIIYWDSTAGKTVGLDLAESLSLYPCSIFLYTLPFVIWGKGLGKKIAFGYICTLGMLGAVLNFLYPISRLTSYSCISFPGFHTFFFHGCMLFTYLVIVVTGMHRYDHIERAYELFCPCVASLLVSIPANIINYSSINADYMYFKGRFFIFEELLPNFSSLEITCLLYVLYIVIPALFYLPAYLLKVTQRNKSKILNLEPARNLTTSKYEC